MKTLLLTITVISALLVTPAFAKDVRYDLNISGMTCATCVIRAEKEFKAMDGVQSVSTNLDTETVSVCADENIGFNDEQLKALFLERGFTYKGMTKQEQC
jgi:copper chaperone CopZ